MTVAERVRGADVWPPADTLKLHGGALLKHHGETVYLGANNFARVYHGPNQLRVLVSLDDRRNGWGPLLHMSLSLPKGYPDWDLIFAVTRAVFGPDIDTMMPIPREEAFIHGATAVQRRGRVRQVFHVTEMPEGWPSEQ